MIRIERHGDVTRLELTHLRSRLIGMSVSVYLVRGMLVDSGFPAIGHPLLAFLERQRIGGAFITHSHEDHAGNVQRLARWGIPLAIGHATLNDVRAPRRIAFYRRFTWGSPVPLQSDVIPLTDSDLRLVSSPGHAHDHHVVWDAREGTLFSADLFLGVKVSVAQLHERPRELVRSLRAAIALGPARMFDAHRGLIPSPVRALEAKVAWLEEVISRVEELAARGWSDRAIQLAVLGREGLPGIFSAGEYSKRNLVTAVKSEIRPQAIGHRP